MTLYTFSPLTEASMQPFVRFITIKRQHSTGMDPWFLDRGFKFVEGVRLTILPLFSKKFPWKWNNLDLGVCVWWCVCVYWGWAGDSGQGAGLDWTPTTPCTSATIEYMDFFFFLNFFLTMVFYWYGGEICKIVKLAKWTLFRQGQSGQKLQFFRLYGKPSKMMKIITRWLQDHSNVKKITHLDEKYTKLGKKQKLAFLTGLQSSKTSFFFRLSGKP